ncbi:MAG: ferritin-like domain-containing protein [Polyangiaceae bacterium]
MASDTYHEPLAELSSSTRDMHRAITTLIEELEAIDWYQQRAEACTDDELRAILHHNKNEEVEHAMMTLEWLRRKNPEFGRHVATYVNSEGAITAVEEADDKEPRQGPSAAPGAGLGIGSLKERV